MLSFAISDVRHRGFPHFIIETAAGSSLSVTEVTEVTPRCPAPGLPEAPAPLGNRTPGHR